MRENDATAAYGVVGAKDNAPEAMHQKRSETHQTWFERGIAGHLACTRPQVDRNAFQRFDFRMAARLVNRREHGIAASADDAVIQCNHRTDGEVAEFFAGISQSSGRSLLAQLNSVPRRYAQWQDKLF